MGVEEMRDRDGKDVSVGSGGSSRHRYVRVEREDGGAVCERCAVADTPFARLRGLLGRSAFADGEGLLLTRTSSIHTCFMRFPIDAVFLDSDFVVLSVAPSLAAWRVALRRGARYVLELPTGVSARTGLRSGEKLQFAPTR